MGEHSRLVEHRGTLQLLQDRGNDLVVLEIRDGDSIMPTEILIIGKLGDEVSVAFPATGRPRGHKR